VAIGGLVMNGRAVRFAVALFFAVLVWLLMEFVAFLRVDEWRDQRKTAPRISAGSSRVVGGAALVAANIWLYLAANIWLYVGPHVVPAATVRPGAVAFAAGIGVFLVGVVIRG
jgi:hypothetical protein